MTSREDDPAAVRSPTPPSPEGGAGSAEHPAARYRRLEQEHENAHDSAKSRSFRMGSIRAATFLAAGAALLAFDVLEGSAERVSLWIGIALIVVFFAEVSVHRRIRQEQRWRAALLALVREGTMRLSRDWSGLSEALPPREAERPVDATGHPFAHDLALFGDASLFRLLGPITSDPGRRIAADWLLAPSTPSEASRRAVAAKELADRLDARLRLSAHGRLAPTPSPQAAERFMAWAEGEPWVLASAGLRAASWILPAILLVAVGADVLFEAPPFWVFPGIAQIVVLRRVMSRLNADFKGVESMSAALAAYVPQMEEVAGWHVESEALVELRGRLVSDGRPAHERLGQLRRIADTVVSRRNIFYAALAPILLLDVHLGARLDRWRRAHGKDSTGWIEALGEWEALCALGSLSHDHPEWTFPTWQADGAPRIVGTSVGHPMLPDEERVSNDLSVGPPGGFTLVTGSNMSGKSTYLRAIGTNTVLAGAGAPVCAEQMTLPRVRLRTSMSIEDNLSQGVSLFMAQLLRVRDIVVEAERGAPDEGPVLYLLDEMLHGTNSAERRIAARAVLRHLLANGAIGAVSTHDLALADAEDLAAVADPVHFRETVHREDGVTRLDFDYRVRPGLAQTSNALALLEAVGLDSGEEPPTTADP